MSRNIILLILAFAATMVLSGCHKSDNSPSYTMKATVNGAPFFSGDCTGDTIGFSTGMLLSFAGLHSDSVMYPYITLGVQNFTGDGTYTMNIKDSSSSFGFIDSSGNTPVQISYGTIIISSYSSSRVSGTFSFTCVDSTRVTDGSFTVKMQ